MKVSQRSSRAAAVADRDRFLFRVDVRAPRIVSTMLLLSTCGCLAVLLLCESVDPERVAPGCLGWSLALLAAAAFIARGVFLGRPVTTAHTVAAATTGSPQGRLAHTGQPGPGRKHGL